MHESNQAEKTVIAAAGYGSGLIGNRRENTYDCREEAKKRRAAEEYRVCRT